jgi:hypothetical protein
LKYASIINGLGTQTFCRQDILLDILKENPDFNKNTLQKLLTRLIEQQQITRVGKDLYVVVNKNNVKPIYEYKQTNNLLLEITRFLLAEFPLADFLVWETRQLNEFVNHQIAHNTIVVETENMLMDSFFNKLQEKYSAIIFEPSIEEYQRYSNNNSIIIERLSSRYPKNKKQPHGLSLEKITVDLLANRLIKAFINEDDYTSIIENIFTKYQINETKLFSYARTRQVERKLHNLIKSQTAIKLYTDKENKQYA